MKFHQTYSVTVVLRFFHLHTLSNQILLVPWNSRNSDCQKLSCVSNQIQIIGAKIYIDEAEGVLADEICLASHQYTKFVNSFILFVEFVQNNTIVPMFSKNQNCVHCEVYWVITSYIFVTIRLFVQTKTTKNIIREIYSRDNSQHPELHWQPVSLPAKAGTQRQWRAATHLEPQQAPSSSPFCTRGKKVFNSRGALCILIESRRAARVAARCSSGPLAASVTIEIKARNWRERSRSNSLWRLSRQVDFSDIARGERDAGFILPAVNRIGVMHSDSSSGVRWLFLPFFL